MGSFNSYPGKEINPEQKQQQDIRQEINTDQNQVISRLTNSVYYFIDCVYILRLKNMYRLVALHKGRVLCDMYCSNSNDCKIAFDKLFKDKAWSEEVKAEWSHFYGPDKEWMGKNKANWKRER